MPESLSLKREIQRKYIENKIIEIHKIKGLNLREESLGESILRNRKWW